MPRVVVEDNKRMNLRISRAEIRRAIVNGRA